MLVPIGAASSVVSLWWSLHRMAAERVCDTGSRPVNA
jgi:hypothetical protein